MNSSGGGASGTGGTGLISFFNGSASAEWGSGNSGNGGLNNGGAPPLVLPTTGTQPSSTPGAGGVLGGVFLSSNTSGRLGCGRFGNGCGDLIAPSSGGGGYIKLRLYLGGKNIYCNGPVLKLRSCGRTSLSWQGPSSYCTCQGHSWLCPCI